MNSIDYLYPKERILDFSDCQYLGEVHQIIKYVLELPDFYGQNLDALWDSLTGIMYLPANIRIIFKPQKSMSVEFLRGVEKIIEVFKEAEQEFGQIKVTVER